MRNRCDSTSNWIRIARCEDLTTHERTHNTLYCSRRANAIELIRAFDAMALRPIRPTICCHSSVRYAVWPLVAPVAAVSHVVCLLILLIQRHTGIDKRTNMDSKREKNSAHFALHFNDFPPPPTRPHLKCARVASTSASACLFFQLTRSHVRLFAVSAGCWF